MKIYVIPLSYSKPLLVVHAGLIDEVLGSGVHHLSYEDVCNAVQPVSFALPVPSLVASFSEGANE